MEARHLHTNLSESVITSFVVRLIEDRLLELIFTLDHVQDVSLSLPIKNQCLFAKMNESSVHHQNTPPFILKL